MSQSTPLMWGELKKGIQNAHSRHNATERNFGVGGIVKGYTKTQLSSLCQGVHPLVGEIEKVN